MNMRNLAIWGVIVLALVAIYSVHEQRRPWR